MLLYTSSYFVSLFTTHHNWAVFALFMFIALFMFNVQKSSSKLLKMTETRQQSSKTTESIDEIRKRRLEEQRNDIAKGHIDFSTMTRQIDATIDRPVAVGLEEKGLKNPGNEICLF